MSFYFGLIMFVCLVPSLWMIYVRVYAGKWRARKLIFGVKNRPEFQEGEAAAEVDEIVKNRSTQALVIAVTGTVISCMFLLLRGMTVQTAVWTGFVLVALFAMNVPYFLGNKEMKALKRKLGVRGEEGVTLVDLSNAGAVRALKPLQIWLPNVIGAVVVIFTLLVDLKVLPLAKHWAVGSFLLTAMAVTFWAMGILMMALAFVMDRLKNEVISKDSTINANYNRAKKKNFADLFLLFCWVNLGFLVCWVVSFSFFYSDFLLMIALMAYMVLLLAGIALFVLRGKKIEARYEKEMTILEDDDDLWIAGMFYYNPKDKRLNVEKRMGVGGTVNVAHPVGKLLMVFAGLSIVAAVACVVWMGMMEATPMRVCVEGEKVICHQLWDEYSIPISEITEAEFGDNLKELHLARVSGVGMDTMLKGNFIVNDEGGCKVFLWRANQSYLMIKTAERTYYVNGNSEEELSRVWESLRQSLGDAK